MHACGNLEGVLEVFEAEGKSAMEISFAYRDDFAEIQNVGYRGRRDGAAVGLWRLYNEWS